MRESETKMTRDTMLKHLSMALKYCGPYEDIKNLEYDPHRGCVICTYQDIVWDADHNWSEMQDFILEINVECDSNAAMINDVVSRINKFFT